MKGQIIKFYGLNDLSIVPMTNDLINLLDTFGEEKEYSINEICALYNAIKFINVFNKENKRRYSGLIPKIKIIIGRFWDKINNKNIQTHFALIKFEYYDDLLEMIVKYKVTEKINERTLFQCLEKINIPLYEVLAQKKLVEKYDRKLKEIFLANPQNAELLFDDLIERPSPNKYFFPSSLTNEDKVSLINRYIESENPNPNYLDLISRPNNILKIDDKIRLKAQRQHNKQVRKIFENPASSIKLAVNVAITDKQDTPIIKEGIGTTEEKYLFSKRYLENSSQNSIEIAQNFVDLIELFNSDGLLYLPTRQSEISAIEATMGVHGKQEYLRGATSFVKDMEIRSKTHAYVTFLQRRGIIVEKVFQDLLSAYLEKAYGVKGITFRVPEAQSLVERIKLILSELDNIAKRFKLFVENGKIDEDLVEITTSAPTFTELKSLNDEKYYETNLENDDIKAILFYLFSDQSSLAYIDIKRHATNFIKLLISDSLTIQDFHEYQKDKLSFLINKNIIVKESSGKLSPNTIYCALLAMLNRNEAIIYRCVDKGGRKVLDEMLKLGWLKTNDHLLSSCEEKWFDYMLNLKRYNNGPQLRNKYIHSSISQNITEDQLKEDYVWAIVILASLSLKIVNDFEIANLN